MMETSSDRVGLVGSWTDSIPREDLDVVRVAGYGQRMGFGSRPVLLVVDANLGFLGLEPLPVRQSVERWRNSCGEAGWRAVPTIQRLLGAFRAQSLPVVFTTTSSRGPHSTGPGRWADKSSRSEANPEEREQMSAFPPALTPQPGEPVIRKEKPSAFFGTELAAVLVDRGIDTMILAGATTSGCVRATAVDAFSHNYRVAVVADAVFDRSRVSHDVTLFDLDARYADVVTNEDIIGYVGALPPTKEPGQGADEAGQAFHREAERG